MGCEQAHPSVLSSKLIPVVPALALLAGGIIASCSSAANPSEESPDETVIDPNETSAGAGGSGDPASGGASGVGGASVGTAGTSQGQSGSGKAGSGGAGPATGGASGSAGRGGAMGAAGSVGAAGSAAPSMPVNCTNDTIVRSGHATWYSVTTTYPACAVAYAALPKYYGAMNEDDYRNGAACGTCARVVAEGKTLDVEIGDLCPYQGNERWCFPGSHHIDLSPDAFAFFADPKRGALEIQWKYVPCAVTGGIAYTFKAESTQYWAEVLVSNYPYEITKLEFMNKQGTYQSVPRMPYNYFQASTGMGGPGPYKLRVTDIHGSTVEDTVPLMPGGTYRAPDNFGLCKM